MKKILFILILLIPFFVYAEYDESKITIESFTKIDTEGYGKELSAPTISNHEISFNIQLSNRGDSVTYELVIKNESGEDVELYNRTSADDYVKYILMSPTLDYVVKNGKESTFQLKAVYDSPIEERVVQTSNYTNSYTYSLEVSNELGKQDIVHAIEDYPDTVDNPSTKVVIKYVLAIVCILFVISIGLFLILRKNKIGKVFIFVGLIGILTPIIVYAYKTLKINVTANTTITKPVSPICKKAQTLSAGVCNNSNGCGIQYDIGETIYFGNLVHGSPKPGDAYDCDVNNDGVYDPDEERFYYVTSEGDESIFIYSMNVENGSPSDNKSFAYTNKEAAIAAGNDCNDSDYAAYGPYVAYQHLPSKTQWSNPRIIAPGTRQIKNELGTTTVDGYTLKTFNYSDRAARLLTIQELLKVCPNKTDLSSIQRGALDSCNWLLDGLNQYLNGEPSYNFWLESLSSRSSDIVYRVLGGSRDVDTYVASYSSGVRPVITIKTSDMETETDEYAYESSMCVRATTLHTERCDREEEGCVDVGYTTGGTKGTTTITYGSLGTKGILKPGDAFDCDINGDGRYDSNTERFYYISGDGMTGTFIYYNNVYNGEPNNSTAVPYDDSTTGGRGPQTGASHLPTEDDWFFELTSSTRTIHGINPSDLSDIRSLLSFDYGNKAARLLTVSEVMKICGSSGIMTLGYLDNCLFLVENTRFANDSHKNYWCEDNVVLPNDEETNEIYRINGNNRRIGYNNGNSDTKTGIRPVIEVPFDEIYY